MQKPQRLILALLCIYIGNTHPTFGQSSPKCLSPEKMMKLIPNHFAGFDQNANPKAKAIRVGNITYSLSEKSFGSSHQAVKILLFDYKEAPVMYNQAVQHWSSFAPVESDSLIQRSVKMLGLSGWELYNKVNRSSQIFIGVHNRFFLTITSENVVLEVLQKMVDHFKLENFSE